MNLHLKSCLSTVILTTVCHIAFSQSNLEKRQQAMERVGDSTLFVNTVEKPPRPKPPKLITHEWSLGFKYNTDGYGLFGTLGSVKHLDDYNNQQADYFHDMSYWEFEINEKKDPREQYQGHDVWGNLTSASFFSALFGKTFIIGKMNNFYQVKIGYGRRKLIGGKGEPGAVSVHWFYAGGVSLGLLKRYRLDSYLYGDTSLGRDYNNVNEALLDPSNIIKGGGITKGWKQVQFRPGLHAKTGLHFDYASQKNKVAAIDIGVNVEYYPGAVNIMALENPKHLFFNLYGAISFGKRKI